MTKRNRDNLRKRIATRRAHIETAKLTPSQTRAVMQAMRSIDHKFKPHRHDLTSQALTEQKDTP